MSKRIKAWRETAIVNAYRGLCLFLLGASPVLARVALGTPVRAALLVGACLAFWRNAPAVALLWRKLPIPEVAREAIASDCAHFSRLTAQGPIFRAGVRLIKRCFDCQRVPLAPAQLRVTAVKAGSAKVTWTPTVVSSLSEEAYRLEMVLLGPGGAEPADAAWRTLYDGPLCTHELRDLAPHTAYGCRVHAYNNKGASATRLERFVTDQLPSSQKGGVAPAYSWAQDVKEVVVRAPVPPGTRAADLLVTCSATHLRASLLKRGTSNADCVLIAGALAKPADPSEFAWQFVEPDETDEREAKVKVEGGRVLELTIPKAKGTIGQPLWRSVIQAYASEPKAGAQRDVVALRLEHPRIDVSLISEEIPELGMHHMQELAAMMKGAPVGRGDEDE